MWVYSRGRQEKHNGGEKKRPNAPTPYIRTPLHATLIYAPYGVLVMRRGSAGPDTERETERDRAGPAVRGGQTDRVEGYSGRDTQERGILAHSTQTAHRDRHGEPRDTRDARVSQMCIARPAGLSVGHLGARGALRGVRGRRISADFIGARAGVVWCAGVVTCSICSAATGDSSNFSFTMRIPF